MWNLFVPSEKNVNLQREKQLYKTMKARYIQKKLRDTAQDINGRIVVLTGARQTGKTTMVRNYLPNYVYLSVEDPVASEGLVQLTASQWKALYPNAILDEVQKRPQLIESIKSVYDQWEEPRYVLLGSSQLLLLNKVKESLAGRCAIMEAFPLTLPELQTSDIWQEVKESPFQQLLLHGEMPMLHPSFVLDPDYATKMMAWNHYQQFGGYPALTDARRSDEKRREWLRNYVRTYLERDVRDLAAMQDLEPYSRLQQVLALQTGALCNTSSLATHIGMSATTVKRYLQYLALSYQTIMLQPWERNSSRRLVKSPKIHYLDNGVLQAVLKKQAMPNGPEFESLVIAEIYKQTKQVADDISFYHLRTADGREIDLLIETPQGYYAFEIKQTEHVVSHDARHLRVLPQLLDKPLLHGFVLSNDVTMAQFGDNITALHAAQFLG